MAWLCQPASDSNPGSDQEVAVLDQPVVNVRRRTENGDAPVQLAGTFQADAGHGYASTGTVLGPGSFRCSVRVTTLVGIMPTPAVNRLYPGRHAHRTSAKVEAWR